MNAPANLRQLNAPSPLDVSKSSVWAQLRTLIRALKLSPQRRVLALLPLGSIIVISANAAGQIRLNAWQGAFYDALQRYDLDIFLHNSSSSRRSSRCCSHLSSLRPG